LLRGGGCSRAERPPGPLEKPAVPPPSRPAPPRPKSKTGSRSGAGARARSSPRAGAGAADPLWPHERVA
jgi:hypothetical protein